MALPGGIYVSINVNKGSLTDQHPLSALYLWSRLPTRSAISLLRERIMFDVGSHSFSVLQCLHRVPFSDLETSTNQRRRGLLRYWRIDYEITRRSPAVYLDFRFIYLGFSLLLYDGSFLNDELFCY